MAVNFGFMYRALVPYSDNLCFVMALDITGFVHVYKG
jgi:hypothetical protein